MAYSEGRFLRVRAVDGGPVVEFPPGEAQIRNIAWSPDNRTILADGSRDADGWAVYDPRSYGIDGASLCGSAAQGTPDLAAARVVARRPVDRGDCQRRDELGILSTVGDGSSARAEESRTASHFRPGRRAAKSPVSRPSTADRG